MPFTAGKCCWKIFHSKHQKRARKEQRIRFSIVWAQFVMNGYSENAIKNVVSRARSMMIHASLHWPDAHEDTLWPLALSHAAFLYNNTPNKVSGIAPIEVFSRTQSNHQALCNTNTRGCPGTMLDFSWRKDTQVAPWLARWTVVPWLLSSASRRAPSSGPSLIDVEKKIGEMAKPEKEK
jgi:hypothetical protein